MDALMPVYRLDGHALAAWFPTRLDDCLTARTEPSAFLGYSSGALRLDGPTGDRVANRRYVLASAGDRTAR